MALDPGMRVGPYEIVGVLGAGAMGRVFRARDTRLERDVALKFLIESDGPDATARLLREARAASALNHPNICQVYDVGESDEGPWIAMEFVPGEPLAARVVPGGLPADAVIALGLQIVGALAHAHTRGIVHRDLKAANCVWSAGGNLKILDFGIARRLPESVARDMTRSATLLAESPAGTPAYMAPEVLRGANADARSDLWAVGVLLYELTTGHRPFVAPSVYELASSILSSSPLPIGAQVLVPLRDIIMRLLEKDPADRYQSAGEVRAALEAIRPAASMPSGPAEPSAHPAARPRGLTLAAGAAIVALLATAVWWVTRDRALELSDIELLSTFDRSHSSPSLSLDGASIAFTGSDADGVSQLWVQDLAGEGAPIQITSGSAHVERPRWHPDRSGVVFVRRNEGIWRVPRHGGTPRRLVERGTNPHFSANGKRMTWEADQKLWVGEPDGTGAAEVQGVPASYYTLPRMPALSPDGSRVVFFLSEVGPNGDLWIIPATGGAPRRLTFDTRECGAPTWTPDGRHIIYSSARAGSRTLWQVSPDGGEPRPLTTGAGEDNQPDISADGQRVVFVNARHSWDIRIADASGNERLLLERRSELLFPTFSPDGARIAFFGRAGRAVAIFTMGRDGSDLRQLTAGTELNHQPRWSHDGEHVYFYQSRPHEGLRRVPALGGPSMEVFPWSWEEYNAVQFGPGGARLVYTRLNAPGRTAPQGEATVVRTLADGGEISLSPDHLHRVRFSRDGNYVAGSRDDQAIVVCDVGGRGCRAAARAAVFSPVAWSPDDSRVYFLRGASREAVQELMSVRVDGTDEQKRRNIGPFTSINRFFDLSIADEVVWAPSVQGRSELWTAALR